VFQQRNEPSNNSVFDNFLNSVIGFISEGRQSHASGGENILVRRLRLEKFCNVKILDKVDLSMYAAALRTGLCVWHFFSFYVAYILTNLYSVGINSGDVNKGRKILTRECNSPIDIQGEHRD
jgi:hypothetical protein